MELVLHYYAITDPFPLQASLEDQPNNIASLMIVASNNTADDVKLDGFKIKIPVGPGANELTNFGMEVEAVHPENWTVSEPKIEKDNLIFLFQPEKGYSALPANSSLNLIFNKIKVNTYTGQVDIQLYEGHGGCVPPDCPEKILSVTKFPYGWGNVSFAIHPAVLPAGDDVWMEWNGPAGATYSIEYYTPQTGHVKVPSSSKDKLSNHGRYPNASDKLVLEQTTTFTLNVDQIIDGREYHAQLQRTATVESAQPQVVSFSIAALPLEFGKPPTFRLSWELKHANYFEITERAGSELPKIVKDIPRDATSFDVKPVAPETIYKITAYTNSMSRKKIKH